MLNFYPDKTKVIFLDLEYYVPLKDRERKSTSGMKFCPVLPGHKVLGGVFRTYYPMQDRSSAPVSIWEWEHKSEKQVITKIFQFLEKEWKGIEFKERLGSLMLSGIGISHSDLPALSSKMNEYQVASPDRIFDVLYGCRLIDLSSAAFCQFASKSVYFTYPKTKRELYQKYLDGKTMISGTSVWDLYDEKKFEDIEARTREEIEDSLLIYKSMSELKKKNDTRLKRLAKLDKERVEANADISFKISQEDSLS